MLLASWLSSPLNPQMTVLSVAVGRFLAPFAEEVLFRGYMFGQLYRRARWGFWFSAIVPSALFALGHAYQSRDPLELLGIFAVTGIAGLFSCWLYFALERQSLVRVLPPCVHESLAGDIRRRGDCAGWLDRKRRSACDHRPCNPLHDLQRPFVETDVPEVDWRSENRSYCSWLGAARSSYSVPALPQ